jgi:hypothetical protein
MYLSLYDVTDVQIQTVLFDDFATESLIITDDRNNTYQIKMFSDNPETLKFKYKPVRDERENTSC